MLWNLIHRWKLAVEMNLHLLLFSSLAFLMARTRVHPRTRGRWRAEQSAIKPSAFSLAVPFLSCWSCAVLAHFSVQSNWRECAGRGKVLRWLLPLSRCQQLLLCIELYKELRSSQINTELWLCPWHIVTALIIYPCSFLLATCSSWLFKVMLPHVGYSRKGVKNKGKLGFNLSSVKG